MSLGQESKTVLLKKLTQEEGLSSYYITKIIQDVYGFLWIGTQDGLNRFDGKKCLTFNNQSEEKYRIGGAYVQDIAEDKLRNLIWVAPSYGTICAIDVKTLTVKKRITKDISSATLPNKWIRAISIQDDILWIGISGGIFIYEISGNKFVSVNLKNELKIKRDELNVSKIFCDQDRRTWVFCDDLGILIFDSKSLNLVEVIPSDSINFTKSNSKLRFWDFAVKNNTLYAATSWGLRSFYFDNKQIRPLKYVSGTLIDRAEIFSCAVDKGNNIWASTSDHFYSYNFEDGKYTAYHDEKRENDDWFTFVYQTYYDNQKNIWIGTQEGLARFSLANQAFVSFFKFDLFDTKIKHAYALLPVSDSIVYCGDENGLYLVNTKTGLIKRIDAAGTNLMIFRDTQKNVYVSNKKGFFLIRGEKPWEITSEFPELTPLIYDRLNRGIQYNDSIILFSSVQQKGLYVWNTLKGKLEIYHNDSVNRIKDLDVINNLYINRNKHPLILTDRGVIYFDPLTKNSKTFTIKVNENVQTNFMDMCETENSYWLALYGNGIIETDKEFNVKRIITAKQGLCNDAVYKVFIYSDSIIIATTNNGLAVINSNSYKIKNYYQSDGLHSSSFEQFCGIEYGDKIYAGGVNGFTIIDPKYFITNTVPPTLYFTNIRTETETSIIDTSNLLMKTLTIPNNWLQTNISFVGLNYSNPERVTYRYKISERNREWVDVGTQNFVSLIGLTPDTYTLQVKAANEDGVWSEPSQLILTFLPEWYQTWWFYSLITLAALSTLYGLYRIRIDQLRKEHKIRTRLASDLHDDLGSTLNSVKVYANLAIMEKGKEKHLFKIKESIHEAIVGVRDIIWVLDDEKSTVGDLLIRLNQFAGSLCEASGISFRKEVNNEAANYELGQEEKRNLYMIIKECINNTIKYANAKEIELNISIQKTKPFIVITDNGKGFDIATTKEGNGLSNMKLRAKQIHYNINIESAPEQGTAIELQKA